MKNLKSVALSSMLAAAAAISLFSPPAMADIKWNGVTLQGVTLQGISLQGISLQGISLQGVQFNGVAITDTDNTSVPVAVKLANGKIIKLL